jgi:hypothetical protein
MRDTSPSIFDRLRSLWQSPAFDDALDFDDSSPGRLVVQHRELKYVFDRTRREVTRGDRLLARFDTIRWVDLHTVPIRNGPTYWRVRLNIGFLRHIRIGTSTDDVSASIVAARIATAVGVQVKAGRGGPIAL